MATLLERPAVAAGRDAVRVAALLGTTRGRYRAYVLVGLALFVLALMAVSFKPTFNLIVSDGRQYYVYLPSLALDGDLDFLNQIRDHWDGDDTLMLALPRTPRGLVRNQYPVGLALTLAPAFLTAHGIAKVCHALTSAGWCVPDGYSAPYQILNLAWMLVLTVAGMVLTDRLLTRAFGVRSVPAGLAVLAFALGSPMLYYTFREPFMAHAVGAFWVTATVYLVWRLLDDVTAGQMSGRRLFLLAGTTSMALICRPTNVVVVPFHVLLLVRILRAGLGGRLLRLLPVAGAGAFPLVIQSLVWYGQSGRFVYYAYDGVGFRWAQPAAWQTLFSSRHGLFFWSPLLLAAVAGVAWHLRTRAAGARPLLTCFVASFLVLWYCNSCWECWWFGDAFGGRAFLELGSFFTLGLAGAFEAVRRAGPGVRRAFAAFVVVALLYHFTLMGLYISHALSRQDYLI